MVEQDALDILCEVFDDRIEDVMSNRDNLSYTLYDEDGYPVGAAIYEEYKDGDNVRYVYIFWIGVHYRGVGIGGQILNTLHQQYPNHWFALSTLKSNTNAIKFYQHHGYTITGDLPGCPTFYHLQRKPEKEFTHER